MALENYVKHEELTGENKYFCDNCKSKHDAIKGLKFKSLPKILVLQLKRFDLDITTLQRIKLNDKVAFPEILNMNPFVDHNSISPQKHKNSCKINNAAHFQDFENQVLYQSQDKKPFGLENFLKKKLSGDNSYFLRFEKNKLIEKYMAEGSNVYELFSIMIHSGSALGGHYYAYIKNFENYKWNCFNDSSVTEITVDDISRVYGENSYTSGSYSNCSTNAYLLMYRRIESESITKIDMPGYILEHIEIERNKLNQELIEKEEKLNTIKIKIIYNTQEKYVEIKKDSLIQDIKDKACQEFNINDLSKENIRIRGYSSYYETFQEVYDDNKTVEVSGIYNHKVLSLEIKSSEEEFLPYDPMKLSLKVHVWEEGKLNFQQLISKPKIVVIDKREIFKKLMEQIQEIFKIPVEKQIILRKSFNGNPEKLIISNYINQSLSYARIFEGTTLFVEYQISGKGKWQLAFEEEQGKVNIKFNDPRHCEEPHTFDFYKYSLSIDSQRTMSDLKQEIGNILKISPDEFIMKKSSSYGPELKDLCIKITQTTIINSTTIYLEIGKPSKPDEIRINFQLALPPKTRDSDGAIYSVDSLFEIPVNISLKIIQVKEILCQELKNKFPTIVVDPLFLRFRYNSYAILGKILNNKDALKEFKLSDKVSICVQLLPNPEKVIDSSEFIIYVKIWQPNTWELSSPYEIIINKNSKIHDLGAKISQITEIKVIFI